MKIAQNVHWGTKGVSIDRATAMKISPLLAMERGKGEIYVTNRRVIFRRGGGFLEDKQIVEASYHHISSIEFSKYSRSGYILGGIIVLGFTFFVWWIGNIVKMPLWLTNILCLILGFLGVLLFFVTPSKFFKIHIVGREPIMISGELEEIIKIIREYREKVHLS